MISAQENFHRFITTAYPMPAEKSAEIVTHFHYKEYSKGHLYLKEGEISNEYCFVHEGLFRAFTFDAEGNEVTTSFFFEGQLLLDLSSFFKRLPAAENVEALADCKVMCVSFDEIQFLFHSMPEFRELGRTLLVNAYALLRQRMLEQVRLTAEQRYAKLMNTNPGVFQHAPLKQIASYLGVTDSSLSRIRKDFSKNHS